MMRLCLWLLCLGLPLAVASAESTHLIYFRMPPIADEVDGKATGPAVSLIQDLTQGLDVDPEARRLPLKRLELILATGKAIVIGIGRTPAREKLGAVWVIELFKDDFHFVTLTGRPRITNLDDARQLQRVACNIGGAPAEFLIDHDFTNLDSAMDTLSEAAKLHAGHVDAWFGLRTFVDHAWRSMGYDPGELQWSPPIASQGIWVAASPSVEATVIETMRRRYAELKSQGKLDPLLAKLIQ